MTNIERALSYFEKGCNCAQAITAAYGPLCGLDPVQSMHIAGAFGGGLARQAETCGAISGALMTLGLYYGRSPIGDAEAKEEQYARAADFLARFRARCGAIHCKDLLGCDISTPEGHDHAKATGLTKVHCPQYVRAAAEILDEMLQHQ